MEFVIIWIYQLYWKKYFNWRFLNICDRLWEKDPLRRSYEIFVIRIL